MKLSRDNFEPLEQECQFEDRERSRHVQEEKTLAILIY